MLAPKFYQKKLRQNKKLQRLQKKKLMLPEMVTSLLQCIHLSFSFAHLSLLISTQCISFLFLGSSRCITSNKPNIIYLSIIRSWSNFINHFSKNEKFNQCIWSQIHQNASWRMWWSKANRQHGRSYIWLKCPIYFHDLWKHLKIIVSGMSDISFCALVYEILINMIKS